MAEIDMNQYESSRDTLISENEAIIERIKTELKAARYEILIAMAWFTDQELLDLLILKAKDGVNIQLKLASSADNTKLDFTELEQAGGTVVSIIGAGYAKMHHKFCIIDQQVALSGSYNWTNNARRNNFENIQVIYNKKIILQLIDTFNKIDLNSEEKASTLIDTSEEPSAMNTFFNQQPDSSIEKQLSSTLDQMIAAEIANFDEEKVYSMGYQRAKSNNGDHNVIDSAMNSLFAAFINDVEVVQDKKIRLKDKLKEQQELSINRLESKTSDKLHQIENNFQIDQDNLNKKINNLEVEKGQLKVDQSNIKSLKIKPLEEAIGALKSKISSLKLDNIKPKLRKGRLAFLICFITPITLYLLIFYSSAAYILVFAKQDVYAITDMGGTPPHLEIFYPGAIQRLVAKGWYAMVFGFLFVLIPIGSAMLKLFLNITNKLKLFFISLFLFIVLDGFIAFKITQTMDFVKVQTGEITKEQMRGFWGTILNADFFLILIMGSLALVIFHFIFNAMLDLINESSSTFINQQKSAEIKEQEADIESHNQSINNFAEQSNEMDKKLMAIEGNLLDTRRMQEQAPKTLQIELAEVKEQYRLGEAGIKKIISIYESHIENDRLPVSETCLNDRINQYSQGWNDYLHDHFSIKIAEVKSSELYQAINAWKAKKLNNEQFITTPN